MLTPDQAAALEALLDERLAPLSEDAVAPELRAELEAFVTARPIEWATRTLSQGEVLAAFAAHCSGELDDVEVLEATPTVLVARWRRETSRLELRAGLIGLERLASETPTMLLTDVEDRLDSLVEAFVRNPELRSRLAVYDLGRLEKVSTVRSSVFVYFEWFLRDAYGVKLLPSGAFTQGLVERGVISLGMG